jgi:hypothetical protein
MLSQARYIAATTWTATFIHFSIVIIRTAPASCWMLSSSLFSGKIYDANCYDDSSYRLQNTQYNCHNVIRPFFQLIPIFNSLVRALYISPDDGQQSVT